MATTVPAGLFEGLFDDAAIFPPGDVPPGDAVPAHRDHRRAWYGPMVGPLVWSDARLGELEKVLASADRPSEALWRDPSGGDQLRLSLVVTGGAATIEVVRRRLSVQPAVTVAAVELAPVQGEADALRRSMAQAAAVAAEGLPVFVEVPGGGGPSEAFLDVLAGQGLRAKLRTGGLTRDAFPPAQQVAWFVHACVERGIAFKCTAGLHHAVRHTDGATGFQHHGFCNLLLAVDAACHGVAAADLVDLLMEDDSQVVARALSGMERQAAASVRNWFNSLGTCSVHDPVDDLVALGLVARP